MQQFRRFRCDEARPVESAEMDLTQNPDSQDFPRISLVVKPNRLRYALGEIPITL